MNGTLILVHILALVVLFPVGWLISRKLYLALVAGTVALSWLGVMGLALWRWLARQGGERPFRRWRRRHRGG